MVPARSRSRLAKRLFLTACATFVAAGAMAYSTGGSQHPHQDEAPQPRVANGGGHSGGNTFTLLDTQSLGDGAGGSGGGGGGEGGGDAVGGGQTGGGYVQLASNGGPHIVYGPGDAHDSGPASDFMPNGEDGLMTLATYAQTHDAGGEHNNSTNNSDHMPGGDGHGPAPTPGTGGGGGGDGSTKTASTGGVTAQGGGGGGGPFGLGGNVGGDGSGGGGGGGSPGPTGGNHGGTTGGGTTPVTGGGSQTPTGGTDPGDGGTICVISATNTCGTTPPNNPPGTPPNTPPTNPPTGTPDFFPNTTAVTVSDNDLSAGVPEPAEWTLMILGFGAVGAGLRARRRKAQEA